MATILPIQDIIDLGKVSIYLSANYTAKQGLFGGSVIKPTPPFQIAMVTDALEWGYTGGAQTATGLRQTANYLYWLCGKFQLEAQQIISGSSGGGSVIPPAGGSTLVNPLDWEVGASSSQTAPLADGETTVTLDGTGGMVDLRGFNINFIRGNLTQYTTPPPDGFSTYYSWSRTTGVFVLLNGAANLGEQFRIEPYT